MILSTALIFFIVIHKLKVGTALMWLVKEYYDLGAPYKEWDLITTLQM